MYNSNHQTAAMQPLLFNPEDLSNCFFTRPTEKELEFKSYWDCVCNLLPSVIKWACKARTGRPGFDYQDVLAVWMVKLIFNQKTVTNTLETLRNQPNLRTITGMESIPSASVVSRKSEELREKMGIQDILDFLCKSFFEDHIVGHVSIDSTIIEAREKSIAKREKKEKKKPGRKKKGSVEEAEYQKSLEIAMENKKLQETGDIDAYTATLNDKCATTGKKNSKGHMQWKIGYKAHLAVDDYGIPVAYVVTGANVHDSKVAVPLLRKTKERCDFLYTLMDRGYASSDIEDFARSMGVVPIIDNKVNRNGFKAEMDKATRKRYEIRTTVERTNSEMKECFLPYKLYSRGKRAILEIELAILLTTIKKMDKVLKQKAEMNNAITA